MSLKKLIIIVIVLFLITLALLGAFFFVSKRTQPVPSGALEETEVAAPIPTSEEETEKKTEPKKEQREFDESLFDAKNAVSPSDEEANRAKLEVFVRAFIEDYGSFSTAGGYAHIEAYYPKMTSSMREFAEQWIAQNPAAQKSAAFYSIQTSVASIRFDVFENARATALVETSRVETDVPEYYNSRMKQDVEVKLVREGDEWKIAGVYWK